MSDPDLPLREDVDALAHLLDDSDEPVPCQAIVAVTPTFERDCKRPTTRLFLAEHRPGLWAWHALCDEHAGEAEPDV